MRRIKPMQYHYGDQDEVCVQWRLGDKEWQYTRDWTSDGPQPRVWHNKTNANNYGQEMARVHPGLEFRLVKPAKAQEATGV